MYVSSDQKDWDKYLNQFFLPTVFHRRTSEVNCLSTCSIGESCAFLLMFSCFHSETFPIHSRLPCKSCGTYRDWTPNCQGEYSAWSATHEGFMTGLRCDANNALVIEYGFIHRRIGKDSPRSSLTFITDRTASSNFCPRSIASCVPQLIAVFPRQSISLG